MNDLHDSDNKDKNYVHQIMTTKLFSLNFECIAYSEQDVFEFINKLKDKDHTILLFKNEHIRDTIVTEFFDKSKNDIFTACFAHNTVKYKCDKTITYNELSENQMLLTNKISQFLVEVLDEAYPRDFSRVASQVLLANNEEPQPATQANIAVPILIKEQPEVTIHTVTPESLFTNAEFPFTVEIISEDVDINDVRLEIIPPSDVDFRGETLHTFSSIQQNVPVSVTSRIITPSQEINTEYKIPFQVIVSYLDDIGQEETDSKTISLLMRPRTFMELTTDGGIWIGDFFIAPYVSLGTIIGIPAGAIFSLVLRKKFSDSKKRKRKKN